MAVVKGMLLVKADTRADTHTIKMMATVNWCCIGTLWVGGGTKHSLLSQNNKIQAQCNMIIGSSLNLSQIHHSSISASIEVINCQKCAKQKKPTIGNMKTPKRSELFSNEKVGGI